MIYIIPLFFPFLILVISIWKYAGDWKAPAVILSALYLTVCVSALFIDTDLLTYVSRFEFNHSAIVLVAFSALIGIALLPGLYAAKIAPEKVIAFGSRWKTGITLMSIYGYASALYITPFALRSIALNAEDVRVAKDGIFLPGNYATTFAVVPVVFFAVYGLVLFSGLSRGVSKWIIFGLILGYSSYAISSQTVKSREWFLQYVLLSILYYWLFGKSFHNVARRVFRLSVMVLAVAGTISVAVITVQRFQYRSTSGGIAGGTIGYLGQQMYVFAEVVSVESGSSEWFARRLFFPLYYNIVEGEKIDTTALLADRNYGYDNKFGTFLASLYLVGGWPATIIFTLTFSGLFCLLIVFLKAKTIYSYSLVLIFYYQFMYQGAFYWMMYGRGWNVYMIAVPCLAVVLYINERGGLRLGGVRRKSTQSGVLMLRRGSRRVY